MQVVINISEKDYQTLKKKDKFDAMYLNYYEKLIVYGTPLPKGHGRLIDADALEKEIVNGIKAGNYEEGYETFAHINDMDDCVDCVRYADTIIEADVPKRGIGTPLEENDSGYNCENWIP